MSCHPCQNEVEMSKYNLDEADIEEQRARFDLYEKEVSGGLLAGGGGRREVAMSVGRGTHSCFTQPNSTSEHSHFSLWPSPLSGCPPSRPAAC